MDNYDRPVEPKGPDRGHLDCVKKYGGINLGKNDLTD